MVIGQITGRSEAGVRNFTPEIAEPEGKNGVCYCST